MRKKKTKKLAPEVHAVVCLCAATNHYVTDGINEILKPRLDDIITICQSQAIMTKQESNQHYKHTAVKEPTLA